ncbi:hypothetical protein [Leuconostoc suionicum]|uniref:hypothetical protein n=1 Tax=Leuconostoc suionicum TaxID=1511761 RepID=UPI001B8D2C32|nr:hypothetical protein [Leuconostoc suionicum]MBS1008694.1 hypothetical protein [Leuconostoc suionicum]
MKQKTWIILNTVISLSLIIALLTATIITGNNIYTKIGTSFFGILIGLSIVPDIKKDGKLTWLSSLFLLLGLYFVLNPWL